MTSPGRGGGRDCGAHSERVEDCLGRAGLRVAPDHRECGDGGYQDDDPDEQRGQQDAELGLIELPPRSSAPINRMAASEKEPIVTRTITVRIGLGRLSSA